QFSSAEELAVFLAPILRDPVNQAGVASLRRALFTDSAASMVRHGVQDTDVARRFAQAFRRQGGAIRGMAPTSAGGSVGASPPVPPRPIPTPPLKPADHEIPLTQFQILDVTFTSDHDKLKDYDKDWKNLGKRFGKPEWRSGCNHPISHTQDKKVALKVKFKAGPPEGRTQYGVLTGKGPFYLAFDSGRRSIFPGENTLTLECPRELPISIVKRREEIAWTLKLEKDGVLDGGSTGPHVIFCTYDAPRDDQAGKRQEDGVTSKRMEAAVELAGEIDTDVPHKLVDHLMGMFPRYSLSASPKIPPQYGHPSYQNFEGGAWAMAQFREPGECQAIVRLVTGVIRQLGVPGESESVVVYAHPDAPRVAREDPLKPGSGLTAVAIMVGESRWKAALTDQIVQEGAFYPPSHSRLDGGKSPGFNSYEACLKFTEGGRTVYYAGGAGQKLSAEHTLHCFKQLIWMERVAHPTKGDGIIVRKVLARYS
ncbi:MAG TPA: hypothetical protein VG457_16735, partial [Planctomycetota bacterium]|nr:hypothetical protein [Planctomycetota bacterium]